MAVSADTPYSLNRKKRLAFVAGVDTDVRPAWAVREPGHVCQLTGGDRLVADSSCQLAGSPGQDMEIVAPCRLIARFGGPN
jgi:hypothetical protein